MTKFAITKPELYTIIFFFFFTSSLIFDVWLYKTIFSMALLHAIAGGVLALGLSVIYHIRVKK